ncbi:hypothetical protein BU15DRAFT_81307 [Melanogaster broomeanus]|nr:hypothetical protein BU15DRAFT_81307 [Melanogaster broomeanus]
MPAFSRLVGLIDLRYNSLNLDSRFNMFFLRSDWHTLFDRGLWLLIPQLEDLETLRIRFTSEKNLKDRRKVSIDRVISPQQIRYDYRFVCRVAQLGIPTSFTGSGDGNKPDNASEPPSEHAPSAHGDGDEPDDASESPCTESKSGNNAEMSTPSKKPSQDGETQWTFSPSPPTLKNPSCVTTNGAPPKKLLGLRRSVIGQRNAGESDAVNDDKMAAYAKEPSRPAPPPESWHKWRPRWEPRVGNQTQFFNTAKFSSNDWAIYEGHAPLTGSAR